MFKNEVFLVPHTAKPDASFSVAWFYPNTYSVGMFGLGYQLVWRILNDEPDVQVHRGFTDGQEEGCSSADLFGFTLAWELDYINVLSILEKNGVPLQSHLRSPGDAIVFGGGPVLSANPEPYSDIFDVVLLGDAETTVPSFIRGVSEARKLKSRRDQLIALAQIPGVYVPSLYEVEYGSNGGPITAIKPGDGAVSRVSKQVFQPPPDYAAHSVILSPDTAWGDIFLVEVVRSCPQECRFCLASFLTRPFRSTKIDTLMDAIETGLKHTKNIGLLGPSVTEHPQFDEIATRIKAHSNARISVASVRADSLTENILSALKILGQKTVTIAIESGSERLRAVMKKNLTEAEIHHAVELIESQGLEGVKFYGIVGLPHETQEDIDETVRLMTQLKKKHKRLRFVFGCSSFVPKAQTPFQWHGRDKKSGQKLEYIRKRLAKAGIDVRPESHNWSDIQALLSRGDRRLIPVLNQMPDNGTNIGAWKKALRELPAGCPGMDYFAFREIPETEILPWSHLVDGARTDFLQKHLTQASALASQLPAAEAHPS